MTRFLVFSALIFLKPRQTEIPRCGRGPVMIATGAQEHLLTTFQRDEHLKAVRVLYPYPELAQRLGLRLRDE